MPSEGNGRCCHICERLVPRGERTKEHVYPRWVRQRVQQTHARWQGRSLILKPVCTDCHTALNRTFESAAKERMMEMFDGHSVVLDRDEQIALAGWFVKTDALLGMWRVATDQDIGEGGRKLPPNWEKSETLRLLVQEMLSTEGRPPANALVRVAHLDEGRNQPPLRFNRPGRSAYLPAELGACVNVIPGGILSESFVISPQRSVTIDADRDRFVQVHPPRPQARWPPRQVLGPKDLEALRAAWEHPRENVVGNFPKVALPRLPIGADPSAPR